VKTTDLTPVQIANESPQDPIVTCPMDRKKQILLTSKSPRESTSELLFVMYGPRTKESRKKKSKKNLQPSHPKLSDKRCSNLSHKDKNT
jgi:hypothetical protein